MATLTIGDQRITVDDSFRSLPPEQQSAAVEEIAASLAASKKPQQMDTIDYAADAAKGLGSGVVRGTAMMAGTGGDLGSLLQRGVEGAQAKGMPSVPRQTMLDALPGWMRKYHENPQQAPDMGSQSIMNWIDKTADLPITSYDPKSMVGRGAQTVGEFVPAAMMGGGGILRGAVAPGIVSEVARKSAEGTKYEAPAAVAGAVVGGSLIRGRPNITSEQLKEASRAGYRDSAVTGLRLDPSAIARVADRGELAMERVGARPFNSSEVYNLNDELRNLPNTKTARAMQQGGLNPAATIDDVKNVRTALGEAIVNNRVPITGAATTPGKAATAAKRNVDDYLQNIPAKDVIAGDAAKASAVLRDATGNWSQAKKLELVEALSRRADLRASSTYAGGNYNNASRQEVRKVLDNSKLSMGWKPGELKAAERAVRGTTTGNVARQLDKMFSPTSKLGLVPAAGAGGLTYAMTGDQETAAQLGIGLAGLGLVGKGVGNASTNRQIKKVARVLASNAPVMKQKAVLKEVGIKPTSRNLAVVQAMLANGRVQQEPSVKGREPVYNLR